MAPMHVDRTEPYFRGDPIQLVVFAIEGQRYALPLLQVDRVLPMVAISRLPQAPPIALGVISLHGVIIPVVDVRRRFGLPPRDHGLNTYLLVARTARRTLAMPVDEVFGIMAVRAEAIIPPHTILPGIGQVAGVATIEEGLLFIHDLEAFLSLEEERQLMAALEDMEA